VATTYPVQRWQVGGVRITRVVEAEGPTPGSFLPEKRFASDDAGWLFSFANICAGLDLDVSSVRAAVRAWQ